MMHKVVPHPAHLSVTQMSQHQAPSHHPHLHHAQQHVTAAGAATQMNYSNASHLNVQTKQIQQVVTQAIVQNQSQSQHNSHHHNHHNHHHHHHR